MAHTHEHTHTHTHTRAHMYNVSGNVAPCNRYRMTQIDFDSCSAHFPSAELRRYINCLVAVALVLCLLDRFECTTSPLFSLLDIFFQIYISTCRHPTQHHLSRSSSCFLSLRFSFANRSFIPAISIAPLQVFYYSEALPTTARILYRSFTPKRTGNCR